MSLRNRLQRHISPGQKVLPAVIAALTGVGGTALVPSQVSAQLEEVVVTARARSESLQDVPATVTAFTENQIRDGII